MSLGLLIVALDKSREGTPLDIGHRDEVPAVDLAEVVDRTDMGMPQVAGRAGLAKKALHLLARRVFGEVGRFEGDLPLDLGVLGQVDRPHRTFAESPDNPVTSEPSREPARPGQDVPLRHRLWHDGFLAVPDKRLGGVARTVERSLGSGQFPHFVLSGDERSKLIGDLGVTREKFLAVNRFAAIDPFQVVAQRGFNPRVFRLATPQLIVHTPTPDRRCPRDRGSRESFPSE